MTAPSLTYMEKARLAFSAGSVQVIAEMLAAEHDAALGVVAVQKENMAREIATLSAALAESQREVERLTARVQHLEAIPWTCAYCGEAFAGADRPRESLQAHVAVCDKHPLRAAVERAEKAEDRVAALTEALTVLRDAAHDALCDCGGARDHSLLYTTVTSALAATPEPERAEKAELRIKRLEAHAEAREEACARLERTVERMREALSGIADHPTGWPGADEENASMRGIASAALAATSPDHAGAPEGEGHERPPADQQSRQATLPPSVEAGEGETT